MDTLASRVMVLYWKQGARLQLRLRYSHIGLSIWVDEKQELCFQMLQAKISIAGLHG